MLSNRTIHYVQPHQTVFEAANYMVDRNVGAVPVLDGTTLVGIFSERDIMKKVVTEGRNPTDHAYRRGHEHRAAHGRPRRQLRRSHVHDAGAMACAICRYARADAGGLPLAARPAACHLEEKSGEADMMRAYIQTSVS